MKNGWDTDYLGMYESMEEYQSAQGYKVNLIQDNNGDEKLNEGVVSEKNCSICFRRNKIYVKRARISWYNEINLLNILKCEEGISAEMDIPSFWVIKLRLKDGLNLKSTVKSTLEMLSGNIRGGELKDEEWNCIIYRWWC